METTTSTYTPAVTMRVIEEPMGAGRLRIHCAYVGDVLKSRIFTLESLAHCLDMPMSTMDGRYARAKLHKWNVPIINGYGRPKRGFPYELLQQVIDLIQTKGATLAHDAHGSGPSIKPSRQRQDLVPEYYMGKQYYTVPALSIAFGLSETTVRKRLTKTGLMRRFIDLQAPEWGGRPKRGIESRYLGDIKLALEEGVAMMTGAERVVHSALLDRAQVSMVERVVPHEAPVPNSLRAWNHDTLAPAARVPVNPVNSGISDEDVDDLMATISAALAKQVLPPMTQALGQNAAPPPAPVVIHAEDEDEHLVRRQMYQMQVEALVNEPVAPTDAELRDTADMLALDKAATDRFVAEVKAARAARGGV